MRTREDMVEMGDMGVSGDPRVESIVRDLGSGDVDPEDIGTKGTLGLGSCGTRT